MLLQLAGGTARGKEGSSGSNGVGVSRFREINLAHYREGERRNGEGDGVPQLTAELVAVVVEAEAH